MTWQRSIVTDLESKLSRAAPDASADLRARLAWALRREDVTRAEGLARDVLGGDDAEGTIAVRARALLTLGFTLGWTGRYGEGVERTEEALRLLGESGENELRTLAHDQAARWTAILGRWVPARTHASAAEAAAQTLGTRDARMRAAATRGIVALGEGQDAAMERPFRDVLDVFEDGDDDSLRIEATACLGIIHLRRGEWSRAIELSFDALDLAVRAGDRDYASAAHSQIGNLLQSVQCPLQARAHLVAALEQATESKWRRGRAITLLLLGMVAGALDSLDEALSRVSAGRDEFRAMHDTKSEATSLRGLANIHRLRGEFDAAERCCRETIALAGDTLDPRIAAGAMAELGRICAAQGENASAISHSEQAALLFEERDSPHAAGSALVDAAAQQLEAGDAQAALATLARVRPEVVRLLAPFHDVAASVHEALGDFESAYRASMEVQRLTDESRARESVEREEHLRVVLELEHVRERTVGERTRRAALQRANAALARGNEDLRELVQIVAHDLRSPLTAVIGGADLVSAAPPETRPQMADSMIPHVVAAAAHMEQIVGTLLDTRAVESGRAQAARTDLDVVALASAVVEQHRASASAKGIALDFEAHAATASVHASSIALRRCLDNLVTNALKFTPPGGLVRVTVMATTDETGAAVARCAIHDSGPGVAEDDRQRLYEKFTPLSARPTAGESSTGLGLYIAGELVRAMDGSIEYVDSDLGGACFRLHIPLLVG